METMKKLAGWLKLRINERKSSIRPVLSPKLKFLGFSFIRKPGNKGGTHIRVSSHAMRKFKRKAKMLTPRNGGKSVKEVVKQLNEYTVGWKGYFHLSETPTVFKDLDSWLRRRLRTIQLKQWKKGKTCFRELVSRGLDSTTAAQTAKHCRSWWSTSRFPGMHQVFDNDYYRQLGYANLS